MALDLKLNIYTTDDCRTLVIEDSTGNYSEDNLGGWGELNVFPDVNNISILLQIKVYAQREEGIVPIEGTISLDTYQSFADLPYNSSYRGFKLALPIEELKAVMVNPEGNTLLPDFENVEDGIYQITAIVSSFLQYSATHAEKQFVFKNICSVSKLVSSALTSVNLTCKDCDDSDLEKALLAKSLLESLENV